MTEIEELLRAWDGLAIVEAYDRTTEVWIWIALHDNTLGHPVGGTRMRLYASPAEGLRDAMRLAEGMTYKWAAAGGSYGGGKAVLGLTRPLSGPERSALLNRYGQLLRSMNGMFSTGPDLGTTPADMAELAKWSPHVHGVNFETGKAQDTSPYTAAGVYHGIRAAVRHVHGADSLEDKTVLIQGVGNVGAALARMVVAAGGRVLVNDVDEQRALAVAREVSAEIVAGCDVYTTECDVYAPCGVGATLNGRTIPALKCRIIAGGANNQLAEPEDAELLLQRGILYAPDYVVNAGGIIGLGIHEWDSEQRRMEGVAGIERTLREILIAADAEGESPVKAAQRLVERRLAAKRAEQASLQNPGE